MKPQKVIKFSDFKPHISGEALCMKCGAEWVAIQPIPAVDPLECPKCGLSHGYFKYPIEENDGVERFSCNYCSGQVFNVGRDYNRCVNCGFKHDKQ